MAGANLQTPLFIEGRASAAASILSLLRRVPLIKLSHPRRGAAMFVVRPANGITAGLAAACTALLLGACATPPQPPTVALSAAAQAIATADRARITDAASPDLSEARTKLAAANAAVDAQDMVTADRLARESRVDAELATARSETAKDQTVNDEMRRSTATLSNEMQRNAGDHQ
jgi:hypothetical protein